ncbi:MAG: hypothetical protein ACLTAT_06180 [Lachnospira eligens]
MAEVMKAIPFTQFSMEMRSGKIIDIDDGFTELLGYTQKMILRRELYLSSSYQALSMRK